MVVHRRYNPENITAYNIVPGLLGIVLTLTLVMMTAIGVTREQERGTMESLLATPVQPLEVMIGKLSPFVIVGIIQTVLDFVPDGCQLQASFDRFIQFDAAFLARQFQSVGKILAYAHREWHGTCKHHANLAT